MLAALHEVLQMQSGQQELIHLIERSLSNAIQRETPSQKLQQTAGLGSFSLLEFTSDGLSKRTQVCNCYAIPWQAGVYISL